MQILHPFAGSVTQYAEEISDPDRYRPGHCPQCGAKQPLTGHGFYCRTLVDLTFDGVIRVRRYLCRICKRTVSLLPEFALPWLRFGISVMVLHQTVIRPVTCPKLLVLKEVVGAKGFEPSTSWSRTSGQKSHKSLSWRHLLVFGPLSDGQVGTSHRRMLARTLGIDSNRTVYSSS
jgi:hypothetical protein